MVAKSPKEYTRKSLQIPQAQKHDCLPVITASLPLGLVLVPTLLHSSIFSPWLQLLRFLDMLKRYRSLAPTIQG